MAVGAAIVAGLKMDTSEWASGLRSATAQADKAGDEISRSLHRKLGAGEFFKGILTGLGIGSVEQIKEFVVSWWKEAADEAKTLAEFSEKAVAAQKSLIDYRNSKKTPEEQVKIAQSDYDKLVRQKQALEALDARQRQLEDENKPDVFDEQPSMENTELTALKETAAERKKQIAQNNIDLLEAQKKVEEKKDMEKEAENSVADLKARNSMEAFDKAIEDVNKITKAQIDGFRELADAKATLSKEEFEKTIANFHKIIALEKEEAAAREQRDKAQDALVDARHDALAFTLGDAVTGARGNSSDRERARQIQDLEARAKRAYDQPGGKFRSAPGQLISGEGYAAELQGRAEQLRRGSRATTGEQDPYKAYKSALADSEARLAQIVAELSAVDPSTGAVAAPSPPAAAASSAPSSSASSGTASTGSESRPAARKSGGSDYQRFPTSIGSVGADVDNARAESDSAAAGAKW